MKYLTILSILLLNFCSSNVPTNIDDFIFRGLKQELVDAERQRKKCEAMKAYWLLTIDPNDRDAIVKILIYDCYESAYGYKKPNYSNSSSSSSDEE